MQSNKEKKESFKGKDKQYQSSLLSYYFIAKYEPKRNNINNLKILGRAFIDKNKNNCKIIYKNKIYELEEYAKDIDAFYNNKDSIKFKILFINNILDLTFMFFYFYSLISLSISNTKKLNISYPQIYINNMKSMFCGCKSLKSLPDISVWNTSKVYTMTGIFYNCNSLKSLPDISK